MKVTREILNKGRSVNGGWSQAQVECLGVSWPLEKHWTRKMIGQEVSNLRLAVFLHLKDKHLGSKALETAATNLLKSHKR